MNKFSQFNIEIKAKGFEGEKIKMIKVLNREIIVYDYKLEESKVFPDRGSGKCLQMQISLNGNKHIIFTSATALIEAVEKLPCEAFPFSTVIIEDNERYKFT